MVITEAQADRLLAGENRRAEAHFYRDAPETAAVRRVITEIEQELASHTQVMTEGGAPPALEGLARLFRLGSFERKVLFLCLAPELDPDFERLYAYVQDDANRRYVTPHLALTLFSAEGEDALLAQNYFLPEAPLRRFCLVALGSGSPAATLGACPLLMDGRVVDYLSGAILFFDEADALFGKRTEVKDSHDRYANIEVNYLLQRMEDYRGLAVLATNMKSVMDHAFLRRLRFLVEFPFPDAGSRRRIWQKMFSPKAPVDGLDYNFLARLEIAGGSIRNIALNAAFLASSQEMPIGMDHIMRATRREYAKIDKLITQAELGPYYGRMKP